MKRIKDIALYSTLCFTLVMLLFCFLLGVAEETLTTGKQGDALSAAAFADKAFLLLMFSLAVGCSFLIFDIKVLNGTLKRVFHILLNYGFLVAFLLMYQGTNSEGNVGGDTTMLIFAASFLFLAVYFGAMGISKGINKLGELIDNAKR